MEVWEIGKRYGRCVVIIPARCVDAVSLSKLALMAQFLYAATMIRDAVLNLSCKNGVAILEKVRPFPSEPSTIYTLSLHCGVKVLGSFDVVPFTELAKMINDIVKSLPALRNILLVCSTLMSSCAV